MARARRFLRSNTLEKLLLIIPGSAWLLIFIVLPSLILLAISLLTRTTIGGVALPVTTESYGRFIGFDVFGFDPLYLSILGRSFGLALLSTLVCALVGYPLAFFIATRNARLKNLLLLAVIIPFWTNFLIRTYAWIIVLGREGVLNSSLLSSGLIQQPLDLYPGPIAVYLGLVHAYLPFFVLPVYASIERIDWTLGEAAADLGATPWQAFWRAIFPQTIPGLLAALLLTFIPALSGVVTPDILGGAKEVFIGNVVQQQFGLARDWPFGSAIAFVLLALVLICLWIYARLAGRDALEQLT